MARRGQRRRPPLGAVAGLSVMSVFVLRICSLWFFSCLNIRSVLSVSSVAKPLLFWLRAKPARDFCWRNLFVFPGELFRIPQTDGDEDFRHTVRPGRHAPEFREGGRAGQVRGGAQLAYQYLVDLSQPMPSFAAFHRRQPGPRTAAIRSASRACPRPPAARARPCPRRGSWRAAGATRGGRCRRPSAPRRRGRKRRAAAAAALRGERPERAGGPRRPA